MSGYYLLKNGEFAYNKSYSVGYDFGSIKRLDRYSMGALSTLYICFALTKHNSDFIKTYFDSLKWYKDIYLIAAEGARNHGLLNVPTEDFFSTKHFIPQSEKEQKKIAEFLVLLDKRIQKQEQLVESLKLYKRGASRLIFSKIISFSKKTSAWKKTTIGKIYKIIMGQSPDSDSYNTERIGLPLVQGNADMKNRITYPQRYTSSPTKTAEVGDVILSVRAPVGVAGRANQMVCLGRGVCSISGNNNDFLYHYFVENETYWKRVEQGGTFTAISGSDIAEMPIFLPPNEEVDKIAIFLNSIDSRISATEGMLASLLEMKSAFLQQMFI